MGKILGLDVSTSCVGWMVLDSETGNVVDGGSLSLAKYKDIFEKASKVEWLFKRIRFENSISEVFIEEPLLAHARTRAHVLALLWRFNGIVSLMVTKEFLCPPKLLNCKTARKIVGINIPKGCKGKSTKEFVLSFVKERVANKYFSGTQKDWDLADAWVIAKAGSHSLD